MKREASAVWQGDLKTGAGALSTKSRVLTSTPYSFETRFEDDTGTGTNPEELIGAAHAGCFSMALSMILGEAGFTPERIETDAVVSLEQVDDGFAITAIHLAVKASVPDISEDKFRECANAAKEGCPVSKVLNADISMDAALE
ncbi:MAG TPA: OsmC family protein [Arenicellales bacterium]|nr:OsmC family protein [Arenicellales bacterium]